MYCPICGKEIEDDKEQFCKYCGVKIGEAFDKIDSKKRPTSVTVISWIIIVISVIDGLIGFSLMASGNNSLGLSSGTIKWGFVSDIINILLAIGILKGLNWCRITFLIFYPIDVLIICSIQKSQIAYVLFYIVFYVVGIIILTRLNATRFFKAN